MFLWSHFREVAGLSCTLGSGTVKSQGLRLSLPGLFGSRLSCCICAAETSTRLTLVTKKHPYSHSKQKILSVSCTNAKGGRVAQDGSSRDLGCQDAIVPPSPRWSSEFAWLQLGPQLSRREAFRRAGVQGWDTRHHCFCSRCIVWNECRQTWPPRVLT